LLHAIHIHPNSKCPISLSGEKLWLLKTEHVLGPVWELEGRSEEEWQHAVLLPIRCAVLSLLDVYLAHWGFDFNNSVAGGSVGMENETMRTEAAMCLRTFLVDAAESGALSIWGWSPNSIYMNPEVDCPALFAQFPALSGAICAAVAADKDRKNRSKQLKLTTMQISQLKKALRRNPTFIGKERSSEESFEPSFIDPDPEPPSAFASFKSHHARAAALAIPEDTMSHLTSQAACVVAAEHKLSQEAFQSCVAPPKKFLANSVDKIILSAGFVVQRNSSVASSGEEVSVVEVVVSVKQSEEAVDHATIRNYASDTDDDASNSPSTSSTNEPSIYDSLNSNATNASTVVPRMSNVSTATTASTATTSKFSFFSNSSTTSTTTSKLGKRATLLKAMRALTGTGSLSNSSHGVKSANFRPLSYPLRQPSACSFLHFDPLSVAHQLTLHLHFLYASIPLREITLDLSFSHSKDSMDKNGQPHLARFRNESERIPNIFISAILETETQTGRAKLIAFLVEVCEELYRSRCLHGLMLVLSALQSNPIHRLKKSWGAAYTMKYSAALGHEEGGELPNEKTVISVKEGYTRLLDVCGIGGRNLSHVAHGFLSSGDDDHRIAFPEVPSKPIMPFLNAALGTLIRLNELPDEIRFENTGITDVEEGSSASKSQRRRSSGSLLSLKSKKKAELKRRHRERILNLSKLRRTASIFAILRSSQLRAFDFIPCPNIQYHILRGLQFENPEDQYQQSLKLEASRRASSVTTTL
jgi:hypothetical protein